MTRGKLLGNNAPLFIFISILIMTQLISFLWKNENKKFPRLTAVKTGRLGWLPARLYREVVGKCRFWHSSIFRIGFWCDDVTGVRDGRRHLRFWDILVRPWCPRCFTVIYWTLEQGEYISGDHLITTVSHHPTGGSGAGVIITPSYVKSFQILGDVLTRSWLDDVIT